MAETAFEARQVTLGYAQRPVLEDLSVLVPEGEFTVIIGPNACGKSTLLRGLARLLPVGAGQVLLDGTDIATLGSKPLARRVGLLAQSAIAPDGITVLDLVSRGRYPHQGLFSTWTRQDQAAVEEALALAKVTDLAQRSVDELSGGQRQRVWVAMVLAQRTPYLMLDEPTTFLDLAHQIELLDLLAGLHAQGRTIVAVLHDLNQAARYATHLIAMRDGQIRRCGRPEEVITAENLAEIFGLQVEVITDPVAGSPLVIPTLTGALAARR